MTSSTQIHPTAIVESGAELAAGVSIGPYCAVGAKAKLAGGVRLLSHVAISGRTEIGERTVVHPFASIGGPPQHAGYKGEDTRLIVGADNVIREYVTMNAGTEQGRGETRVGSGSMFMASSHVAHDCIIGDNVIFANCATLGGHVIVEDGAFLGGLCAIHQFCRVGAFAFIGGCAAVPTDVIPYGSAIGNHAHLAGLNLIGLKRRGVSREAIHDLRAAYRILFAGEGAFRDRVAQVDRDFAARPEVQRIIAFIRSGAERPLMAPAR